MGESEGLIEELDTDPAPALTPPRRGWLTVVKVAAASIVVVASLAVSTHLINTYLAAALGPDRTPPPVFSGADLTARATAVLAMLGTAPKPAAAAFPGAAEGIAAASDRAAVPAKVSPPEVAAPAATDDPGDRAGGGAGTAGSDILADDPRLAAAPADSREIATRPGPPPVGPDFVAPLAVTPEISAIAASFRAGVLPLPEASAAAATAAASPGSAEARQTSEPATASPPSSVPRPPAIDPQPREAVAAWRVQLMALRNRSKAQLASVSLQQANPDLLEDLTLRIEEANLQRGTFYRVQAGPLANRAEASLLCGALKARHQDCLIVAP